ncbi:MAG: PASTA domain-containing protein, partial [Solirubrobacterales bacterium]
AWIERAEEMVAAKGSPVTAGQLLLADWLGRAWRFDESAAVVAAAAGALGADPAEAAMASEQQAAQAGESGGWMTRKRAAIIAAILLLLGAVAAYALTRPEQLPVPNVLEQGQARAQELLEAAGFDVRALPRPNCADADSVVEQDPGAGEDAEEGSTVTITVSTGQDVSVPQVQGMAEDEATKRLQRAELLVRSKQQFSERMKPGRAIGTRPAAGAGVECQSPVRLLISRGIDLVTLPGVIGLQREEAESELKRLGFIVDVDTRDADQPEGEVIGQSPGPESRLERGDTVTIIVSTGAGSVIVPNVEGQSEDSARANLTGRGLNVVIREEETLDPSEDGEVIDQAPGGGTRVVIGDTVTIVVGVYEEPPEEPPAEEPPPPAEGESEAPKRGPG